MPNSVDNCVDLFNNATENLPTPVIENPLKLDLILGMGGTPRADTRVENADFIEANRLAKAQVKGDRKTNL